MPAARNFERGKKDQKRIAKWRVANSGFPLFAIRYSLFASFGLLHTVPFFADLVVIARSLYPIPSRTRPSNSSAPMVLSLKAWKSRSPPGLPRTEHPHHDISDQKPRGFRGAFCFAQHPSNG